MSKESLGKKERVGASRWTARVIGTIATAAALMIPSTHSLAAESIPTASVGPAYELQQPAPPPHRPGETYRDTGLDSQACHDFGVCGTDLGEPFTLPNGSIGYLFGDTFKVAGPFLDVASGKDFYRPQVMLRSHMTPKSGQPIIFDNAAGLEGTGLAPELLFNGHSLANDAVSLPNGDIVMSYQHVTEMKAEDVFWQTDRAGLAISHDGNHFELVGPSWENNGDNKDPYQMWSMQIDGDFVYIVSVRAGRQPGPMMLFRVRWDQMRDGNAYTYWNGTDWGGKDRAQPILQGHFGEPSLRKLADGTWAMAYTDYSQPCARIVTRVMTDPAEHGPEGPWSAPKEQLNCVVLPAPYGGFIHPGSTKDNLILMVSTWQAEDDGTKHGKLLRYDVSHFNGAL